MYYLNRRTFILSSTAFISTPILADEVDAINAIKNDFGNYVINEGKIKIDMPDFSDSGASVPMDIFVPTSPSNSNFPRKLNVYAPKNPRPRLLSVVFSEHCGEAHVSTRVRLGSFQDIIAVVENSDGHTYSAKKHVNVTYGACEDIVANDQFPPGWAPKMRISAPKTVLKNEIFTVRTIINHPMETGLRHDKTGLRVPVRIAENFTCIANGTEIIKIKLEPAIAANPYLAFSIKLHENSNLEFIWVDTTGEVYKARTTVNVT
jgi:sulfur-oxidizing protein SoxY